MVGRVAIQQAMREHFGFSYRKIAKYMRVHHRTVWQHVNGGNGAHCKMWNERNKREQETAIHKASMIVISNWKPQ